MSENGSNKKLNDVDKRIVSRLGARSEKMERMEVWERSARKNRRLTYFTVAAIAACLALILVINPFSGSNVMDELGIQKPSTLEFRAAVPELDEVDRLIDSGKYYEALDIAEAELKDSDTRLKELARLDIENDEELQYEYRCEKLLNAELRWAYIYLLVMAECDRTAIKELKRYLKEDEFCTHRKDAENLLRALS